MSRPVVHLVPSFPPSLGGMEQRTAELAAAQAKTGRPVTVVTTGTAKDRGVRDVDGCRVVRIPVIRPVRTAPIAPTLPYHLVRLDPEAVWQVHLAYALFVEQLAVVARIRRHPFVVQIHIDPEPTTALGRFLPAYKRRLLAPALRQAAAVVVPTPAYGRRVSETYGVRADRLVVIPPGNRFEVTASGPRNDGPLRLLTVARLAPEKNIELTLTAFAQLQVPATLTVVGDGPSAPTLRRLASELGIEGRVTFTGRLDGEDLDRAYRCADVFVMTSREESFGSVVVEALAHSLPAVVPDIDGPRDIVVDGDSGLVVPHDARAVVAAIERIARDPRLAHRLASGGAAVVGRYSWRAIVRSWDQLYDRIGSDL